MQSADSQLRRVLILTESYLPRVGGAERLLGALVGEANNRGVEVRVVLPRGSIKEEGLRSEVDLASAQRTRFGWWFSPGGLRRRVMTFDPQVIQTSGPSLIEWGVLWLRRLRIPMASLYHAHLDLSRRTSLIANRAHVRVVLPRFDGVVTVSPQVAADLRRWRPGLPVATITPGLLETPTWNVSRRRGGRDILFVGRLPARHAQKRPDVLLRALQFLPSSWANTKLHLVGEGPGRPSLERMASEIGVAARTVFHGYLTQPDLESLYQQVGCLVLPSPSRSEGFGLVIIEALEHNVPVVLSDESGGAHVVVETGCGHLFRPNDPRSLAGAIERTLLDNERGAFDDYFDQAKSLFLTSRMTEQYINYWKTLQARSGRPNAS
jgi:glycosyltransferase involved in cell wall biosynthesis